MHLFKSFALGGLLCFAIQARAQYQLELSSKVTLQTSVNLETYFFVEKLAVEHIQNFVFNQKEGKYSHQPIVHFAFQKFRQYVNDPQVLKMAALMRQLRDHYHDNGPIMDYLLNQKPFPEAGLLYSHIKYPVDAKRESLLAALTAELRNFYQRANVSNFLEVNAPFYRKALKEVAKDVDVPSFKGLEQWFGKTFPAYQLYLVPSMPIPSGEDNYRGYGPRVLSPAGPVPAMIMSSSKMLPLQQKLNFYTAYGFDNPGVTHMLTKHEIGHSFVNSVLEKYLNELDKDSMLFTPRLKAALAPVHINSWRVCIIEHLVRLAEIRTALFLGDTQEAARLRQVHIGEYKCVLIPLLEKEIANYETNRAKYPTFESYLPEIVAWFHTLSPEQVDEQID
jgi:hypothetical protein